MKRVGVIGMGFMGGTHFRAWRAVDGARVVAVCDANPISAKKGNLDTGSDELDLSGVAIHTDVAEMLAAEKLDAVSIALPTHLHRSVAIQCLEAGAHVLCEKPMALSVEECDAMIAAAKSAGKALMVAHCIRFWPEYVWLKNAVASGAYGAVRSADFTRLTFAPGWDGGGWFADPAKSGGLALDLHIHDLDFIQHLLGEPESISARTARFENGVVGHVVSRLDYGPNRVVSATASWMMPESYGFGMSYTVQFERGAAVFGADGLTMFPAEGAAFRPELESGDGYAAEIEWFARKIAGEPVEPIITPEQARASVRLALETMKDD